MKKLSALVFLVVGLVFVPMGIGIPLVYVSLRGALLPTKKADPPGRSRTTRPGFSPLSWRGDVCPRIGIAGTGA